MLVVCAVLVLAGTHGRGLAQATLGAPSISSVVAGTNDLTVVWTAPAEDGGAAITAYDLRYIETAAPDKADANWTVGEDIWSSGTLSYELAGLREGTAYDVQLRAVNANGDGPWSSTSAGTTGDHGASTTAATAVTLGSPVPSRLGSGTDVDFFRITLAAETELWARTTGGSDTMGTLLDSSGTEIEVNDNGLLPVDPHNFSIRSLLSAGTYYIRVESPDEAETGPYTLHVVEVTRPGDSIESATEIDTHTLVPGLLTSYLNAFEFTLDAPADLWFMVTGNVLTRLLLFDSDGARIDESPQSGPLMNRESTTVMGDDDGVLAAGTYRITVERYFDFRPSRTAYTLYIGTIGDAGDSAADATPLELFTPSTGLFSSQGDEAYYSLTLEEDAYVYLDVLGLGFPSIIKRPITVTLLDHDGADPPVYMLNHTQFNTTAHYYSDMNSIVWGHFEAGTHRIKLSTSADGFRGRYVIHAGMDTTYQGLLDKCASDSSPRSDPLYLCQWGLNNINQFGPGPGHDINVEAAWETTQGENINIAVVDNGLDYLHDDLVDNVVQARNHDYGDGSEVFAPLTDHGTKVAGIIAARDNSIGVRGVAPRANIWAYDALGRTEFNDDDVIDSVTRHMADTAVVNNSWGQGSSAAPKPMPATWEAAIRRGVELGFAGKGTFYVWSAGNGARSGDNANLDELKNHVGVTAVCAVNYQDVRASYSDIGANLWVCAPSGETVKGPPDTTTTGNGNRYDSTFAGTSASAPVVSGVAALVRAANNALTWRDVKLILAGSARKNHPSSSGWQQGALQYGSTSERYSFNHEYGFGVVDAGAAVALSQNWDPVPAMREVEVHAEDTDLAIPDAPGAPVTSTVSLDSYIEFVEFVELNTTWDHESIRDLRIELVSPSGAVSTILPDYRTQSVVIPYSGSYRFGSSRHLGEAAAGTWTLRITDRHAGHSGSLTSWSLKVYGHSRTSGPPRVLETTPGDGAITVFWAAPTEGGSSVSGYDLRYIRSDATDKADANWAVEDIWSSGALSYQVTGLDSGAQYDLQVRAVNSDGKGPWSLVFEAATTAVAPGLPTITGVSARDGALEVTWLAPGVGTAGLQRYDVRYILSSATDKADAHWTVETNAWSASPGGDLRYEIDSLLNDSGYDVQVRAVNSAGTGDWSATSTGTPAASRNAAPSFPTIQIGAHSVDENSPRVNVGAPVRAIDPEGDRLTYRVSTTYDPFFTIDGSTGQIRTRKPLDHETSPTRIVSVMVTDSRDSSGAFDISIDATTLVTVTINDLNEAPAITAGDGRAPISRVWFGEIYFPDWTHTFGARDPEGDVLTWSLEGEDRDDFTLAGPTLTLTGTPDFESPTDHDRDNVYHITLRLSDGSLSETHDITIWVNDVDEPPTITGPTSIDVMENSSDAVATYVATDPEGGAVILSLTGNDAGHFSLAGGVLSFATTPDFEARADADADADNTYEVTLEAADARSTTHHDVAVTVTNEDEPGTLTLSSEQPLVGEPLTATLTDLDGSISNQSWVWERSPDRSVWSCVSDSDNDGNCDGGGPAHTPVAADENHHLRVTVTYTDGHGAGKSEQHTAPYSTRTLTGPNNPPHFASPTMTRSVKEGSPKGTPVGDPVRADDPDGHVLGYKLRGSGADRFDIDLDSGQIRVGPGPEPDFETQQTYAVTVVATDPLNAPGTTDVTIHIIDVDERPKVVDDSKRTPEDIPVTVDVTQNVHDPEGEPPTVSGVGVPQFGTATKTSPTTIKYTPNRDTYGVDQFEYTASVKDHQAQGTVFVTVDAVNDGPRFDTFTTERTVSETADAGTNVGLPVSATDVDGDRLTYRLLDAEPGPDDPDPQPSAHLFEIEEDTGQITVAPVALLDAVHAPEHTVVVTAEDPLGAVTQTQVTITVTKGPTPPVVIFGGGGGGFAGGGGGGGGGGGPSPSVVDFEWSVTRDIDELDSGHDKPSGQWSDGATLWVLENGDGADDAIYAYDLKSGERVEEREFELAERNRAPRGVWSDHTTIWVSDSGQNRLFAHDLETGERLEERDIALAGRNRDARGIWSGDETMWVLDGGKDSVFAYDLASGDLLAEYELASTNGDPHGIWSDQVTVWVSDHGAKRLFAYRLPARPEAPAAEDAERQELERVSDEEFKELSKASNNSPRGIWSDGDVMYVADASDARVYSYNMPNAIDARLASLSLSGVDIGEFSSSQTEYTGTAADGTTATTVGAEAVQRRAGVAIDPPDADEAAEGHQVALKDLTEITVTVTSADTSRTKVYRVRLGQEEAAGPAPEEAAGLAPDCLRGAVTVGFSLVVYEGGSMEDLVACAEGRSVTALYALAGGEYVSYIRGAPEFVNRSFAGLFADGVPVLKPLTVKSEGPATAAPRASAVTGPWAACLQGEIAEGFNLVVYEGGSVDDLVACAEGVGLAALYALNDGVWISYILGAPDFVNRSFRELFTDGLPVATPLVGKRD